MKLSTEARLVLMAVPVMLLVPMVSIMAAVPWYQALILVVGIPVYLWAWHEVLDQVAKHG